MKTHLENPNAYPMLQATRHLHEPTSFEAQASEIGLLALEHKRWLESLSEQTGRVRRPEAEIENKERRMMRLEAAAATMAKIAKSPALQAAILEACA